MRMRTLGVGAIGLCAAAGLALSGVRAQAPAHDYPIRPVSLKDVKLDGGFWGPRLEVNRTVTIPAVFKQEESTGRVKNFEIAGGTAEGAFCTRYPFDDSDVYKGIEAASYSLEARPDPALETLVDTLVAKIARAQEKDGYIYTARTINPAAAPAMAGKARWVNEEESHELYNAGHLYEAAAAHFRATGRPTLLDVAKKNAELIMREFGPKARQAPPGHQEIEIGLVKLYRVTGDPRYLAQAKFFLDQRGRANGRKLYGEYSQDHLPVADQKEAVGHAVRAAYMYSAMADVAALTGDTSYVTALDRLWANVVSGKLYLTGGIGATGAWEGFGPSYELPNASAYAETCAAIASALWNHRMFLLHGDAAYIDIFERTLYNGLISGVSLAGDRFFYPNPLASFGQHERSAWFGCACCPPNVARFIAQLPVFAYATSGERVYVNLFAQGTATLSLPGGKVSVEQTTAYPWSGAVSLRITPAGAGTFTLMVRVPGWARNKPIPGDLYQYADASPAQAALKVNGTPIPLTLQSGYAPIARQWKTGDVVELTLPMDVRRVVANPAIKDDVSRVAVERGPLVYCAEGVDNAGHVNNLVIDERASLKAEARPELLGGVAVVAGAASGMRYQQGRLVSERQPLTLVPYYAWANRGRNEMAVWLARTPDRARPIPEPTLASTSKASASGGTGVQALNDQFEPSDSNDHSTRYFHWWPKKGTLEWVQYDFPQTQTVSEVSIYWFDDTGQGECRVPKAWKLLYKDGDEWVEVKNVDPYGTDKDRYNAVRFDPVKTTALRINVQLPDKFSAGIHEWKVK